MLALLHTTEAVTTVVTRLSARRLHHLSICLVPTISSKTHRITFKLAAVLTYVKSNRQSNFQLHGQKSPWRKPPADSMTLYYLTENKPKYYNNVGWNTERAKPASVALLVASQYALPGYGDRRVWVRGPGWPDHSVRL